jgi:chromosome segregation ATPase
MQYLALLLDRPNTEVHVLELARAIDHPDRSDAGELVDPGALRAYRKRLDTLRDELETAQALGDVERAERARDEMENIAAELARTTQKGGRARRAASVVDRARSAVQRRIKDALDRIAEQDPDLGARLKRSINTGNYCVYRPDL